MVTTSGGPAWEAGLLGASITAPHLLGPFVARRVDLARDGRNVIAIASVLHGATLAAAVLLFPYVWPIVTAAILVASGLLGPLLTGGISSRLAGYRRTRPTPPASSSGLGCRHLRTRRHHRPEHGRRALDVVIPDRRCARPRRRRRSSQPRSCAPALRTGAGSLARRPATAPHARDHARQRPAPPNPLPHRDRGALRGGPAHHRCREHGESRNSSRRRRHPHRAPMASATWPAPRASCSDRRAAKPTSS